MTLNRYATRRDATEQLIVRALRNLGFHCCLINQPFDCLASRAGVLYAVEFKSRKGNLTPAQRAYRDFSHAPVIILRDAAGAIEWAQSLVVKETDTASQRNQADHIDGQDAQPHPAVGS